MRQTGCRKRKMSWRNTKRNFKKELTFVNMSRQVWNYAFWFLTGVLIAHFLCQSLEKQNADLVDKNAALEEEYRKVAAF